MHGGRSRVLQASVRVFLPVNVPVCQSVVEVHYAAAYAAQRMSRSCSPRFRLQMLSSIEVHYR